MRAQADLCPDCGGSGEIEIQVRCSRCEGFGRLVEPDPETGDVDVEGYSITCPVCGGAGSYLMPIPCPTCQGDGHGALQPQ